jgi:hypothetical protein
MAEELQVFDLSFMKASADLSNYQFKGVKISTTDFTVQPATAGACDGILQNKPAATGRACLVRCSGVSQVVLGGTVTAGQLGKSDGSATFVAVASDKDQYIVKFLEGGDAGDRVTALVLFGYYAV